MDIEKSSSDPGPVSLPASEYWSVVVRTDFSDAEVWEAVRDQITSATAEGLLANVKVVDDLKFADFTTEDVLRVAVESGVQLTVFIVDTVTIEDAEHPVLVLAPQDRYRVHRGDTFRALPSAVQSIENNLNLSNMDWPEFAESTGDRDIFRGF